VFFEQVLGVLLDKNIFSVDLTTIYNVRGVYLTKALCQNTFKLRLSKYSLVA